MTTPTTQPDAPPSTRRGHIQSLDRAFRLLEAMADAGGIAGVSELSQFTDVPTPTIHRVLRTLVSLGYVRQEPSREYALGPRLVALGDAASRLLETWANPHMRRLAELLGESANLALMDGTEVVYVAQAPGRHSMRMFTEVGHRAGLHCTAVGKAILASYAPDDARAIVDRLTLYAHTSTTITSPDDLMSELDRVRERGYATDEGEREVGVFCVAVPLPGAPTRGAVSISGPVTRMTDDVIQSAVPMLQSTARDLAAEFDSPST